MLEQPESAAPSWSSRITDYSYVDFLGWIESLAKSTPEIISSVAISFGVAFSKDGRIVKAAGKMSDFEGRRIADDVEAVFQCPSRWAHDCICALLAEETYETAPCDLAYVTVSSGTGAAVSLRHNEKRMLFRVRVAHQVINKLGPECNCGQRGCLAAYTDGKRWEASFRQPLENIRDEVFWQSFVEDLAIGLVNLSWMVPIDRIVLGGGIVLNNEYVRQNIAAKFDELRKTGNQRPCSVRLAKLGEMAPLIGAFTLATTDASIIY